MTALVEASAWDAFVAASEPGSYLQTSAWARVKAVNGWTAHRITAEAAGAPIGAQILVRRPRPMPWGFAYAPRGPVATAWTGAALEAFTEACRAGLRGEAGRVSHVRIDPEIEAGGPLDPDRSIQRALRVAGWRPGAPIQPASTRVIDLHADEGALWGDLRKKWRQYVNKARAGGIVVVDAEGDRLPEFHRIYRETADRAGFLIRTEAAYRDVWEAFRPGGNARLLFAQTPDGEPVATLFLVRAGPRVVEPYGGMTAAGAESRANYLLKWEAIRTSREAGATSYDLWGLATGGIAHFKTGFGGREVRYIGAWDLVLDPFGRQAYETALKARVRWARRRHGVAGATGAAGFGGRRLTARDATAAQLETWDAEAVDAPGGHVYQSRAWADQRAASGWRPRFLVTADGGRVLALERPWPWIGGGSAYVPRGPAPVGVDGAALAARQVAAAEALASGGIDVVAADPEAPAADAAFLAGITTAGFRPIEEIQPSRHRIRLLLKDGVDEMLAFGHIAKSTRQRIRAAESAGLAVVRHDARIGPDGAGEGFARPTGTTDVALDRFYDLLLATGERRRFTFGPREAFTGWWRRAHAAGHLVYLEVRERPDDGEGGALAGLILYRHGGRLSTVHSGDHAETRRQHPGALHLARWRAIQLAIRERCSEMDLGGADVAGARRRPVEGEPMWGLYQHKLSFGGQWLELAGAHERVFRPRRYAVGRAVSRAARLVGR